MAFNPVESVKAHPWLYAGGVFVLGIILVVALSGGTANPTNTQTVVGTPAADPSLVAANSAMVQGQLAAGVANQQTAAQLQAQMAGIASQTKIAELGAQNDASNIQAQTQVAIATVNAQRDTQNLVSTLSAQVSQAQIAAQQASAANANATNVQIAALNTQAQRDNQAFMAMVQTGAQETSVRLAGIASDRDMTINAQNSQLQQNLAVTYREGQRDVLAYQDAANIRLTASMDNQVNQAAWSLNNQVNQSANLQSLQINQAAALQASGMYYQSVKDDKDFWLNVKQVDAGINRDNLAYSQAMTQIAATGDQNSRAYQLAQTAEADKIQYMHAELYQHAVANSRGVPW